MSELTKRLRELSAQRCGPAYQQAGFGRLDEAADELDRLTEENEKLTKKIRNLRLDIEDGSVIGRQLIAERDTAHAENAKLREKLASTEITLGKTVLREEGVANENVKLRECVVAMLEEYEEGRNIQPFEIREMCRKALDETYGEL